MIRSMTGYGSAAVDGDAGRASVAVRALNHRFLDLAVHLPRRLQALEPDVRRLVQSPVQRGRVEPSLQAEVRAEEATAAVASSAVVAGLVGELRRIRSSTTWRARSALRRRALPRALEVVELEGSPDGEAAARPVAPRRVRPRRPRPDAARRGRHLERDLLEVLAAVEAAAGRLQATSWPSGTRGATRSSRRRAR